MVMTPSFYLHVHVTGELNESQEYSLTPEEKKQGILTHYLLQKPCAHHLSTEHNPVTL